ncbi:MAG: hypothetical protein JW990_06920 [Thermoleophilia bacterium]|nr:hypothetical protein [Thermoleophilia bacterium]
MTRRLRTLIPGWSSKVIDCAPLEPGSRVYAPLDSTHATERGLAGIGITGFGKTAAAARIAEDGSVSVDDRRLPTVTPEVFATDHPSLQQIRDAWRDRHQSAGGSQGKLAVTREGQMVLVDPRNRRETLLPEVTPEVFATGSPTAVDVLPRNATWMVVGGLGGWTYSFADSHYGDIYTVFVYQRPATGRYYAQLISPDYSELRHHHWFPDGRMCLTPGDGSCDSIGHAHARIVAWAKASSHSRRTGQFLFD